MWRSLFLRLLQCLHFLVNLISGGLIKPGFHNTDQVCSHLWSHQLQQAIIDLILDRLGALDRMHFGAVCSRWRAAVARSKAIPTIAFPFVVHSASPLDDYQWFSSLDDNRYCSLNPFYKKGSRLVGVIGGRWLIMQKYSGWLLDPSCQRAREITTHSILNPVSGEEFMLPRQFTVSGDNPSLFDKVVASSEPTASNCLVAGLRKSPRCSLAFCRLGDLKWTLLNQQDEVKDLNFDQIIFCDGKLFASTAQVNNFVIAFELRQKNEDGVYKSYKIVMTAPSPNSFGSRELRREGLLYTCYFSFSSFAADLVSRELLLIVCDAKLSSNKYPPVDLDDNYYQQNVEKVQIVSISLYKMDIAEDQNQWIKVSNLGDHILFFGNVGSFFIPTQYLGESTHQGNCIYYAFGHHVGKFCLNNQAIIHYPSKHVCGWFVAF